MKHLKTFENYENIPVAKYQLEKDQVDDLNQQFELFVEEMERDRKERVPHDELLDIFAVDDKGEISDDFVRFIDYLEENTDWFNYDNDMMDKVKNDLSIVIGEMEPGEIQDEDDFEFAQDDPNWPYEKEEGEMLAHGEEDEEDEIEQLRQKTYSKEQKFNMDDILDKINAKIPLTDEEKDFLSKQENMKILNFKKFKP